MSITTLKLFETLLTKPNEQIINNLVLRNLLGRSYVTVETIDSGHHSPTPDEQGHHHDNHNNTDSLHSNPSQGQCQGRLGEGEEDETCEQENPSQTSSSSEVKNVESSQNVISTDQNQRDSREQQEQEQKTSSELLTNGATNTTASTEDKSSPSDKTSDDNGDSQNKTDEPGKDNNAKGSEQSVKGDGDIQRQRHHSDFESELDEILGRVSSSGEGDATGDTGADTSFRVKSSSQTGTAEEEAQLVSRYGKVLFIQ